MGKLTHLLTIPESIGYTHKTTKLRVLKIIILSNFSYCFNKISKYTNHGCSWKYLNSLRQEFLKSYSGDSESVRVNINVCGKSNYNSNCGRICAIAALPLPKPLALGLCTSSQQEESLISLKTGLALWFALARMRWNWQSAIAEPRLQEASQTSTALLGAMSLPWEQAWHSLQEDHSWVTQLSQPRSQAWQQSWYIDNCRCMKKSNWDEDCTADLRQIQPELLVI